MYSAPLTVDVESFQITPESSDERPTMQNVIAKSIG